MAVIKMSLRMKKRNSTVFFTQTRRKESFWLDLMRRSNCKDTRKKLASHIQRFFYIYVPGRNIFQLMFSGVVKGAGAKGAPAPCCHFFRTNFLDYE